MIKSVSGMNHVGRNVIAYWFAVVVLASGAVHADQATRFITNLRAGQPQTLVTYGTSLTAGGAWVEQLREALAEKFSDRATVINSGQGGMWSTWGVDNLQERVIDKKPDAVLIEFAINDAFLTHKTEVGDARANLIRMIDRIQQAKPTTEVILMTMNPPIGVHLERRPKIQDYYQMYRDVARDRKLLLVDHCPRWERLLLEDKTTFDRYMPDGLHPEPEGCSQIITPAILKAIGLPADQLQPVPAGAK